MTPQLKSQISTILCRIVVPAWVATGAIVKLMEATPKLLPEKTILEFGKMLDQNLNFDLLNFLGLIIAIEFVCIIVMILLQKYARATAIFILSVFCIVLIGEMVQGNITKCGCFGGFSPPPWAMLIADGGLLLGILFLKPINKTAVKSPRWQMPLAIILSIATAALSFGVMINVGRAPEIDPKPIDGTGTDTDTGTDNPDSANVDNGETPDPPEPADNINPNPIPLKAMWYLKSEEQLIGMPWRQVEIFQFMPIWPSNMDEGEHFVVFYSRTCEHCQEMFDLDLSDPQLGSIVTAIELPTAKNLMRPEENAWPMPSTECELLSLPLGCDWVITPPMTFRIEDGIITCVKEGGHSECMGLGPEDH